MTCSLLHCVLSATIRVALNIVPADIRANIFDRVLCDFFERDKEYFIGTYRHILSNRSLGESEKELLVTAACGCLAPPDVTDRVAESFEQAIGGSFHFSQEGEDILLLRLIGHKTRGFYVDVGAHHPTRFSNTYALYRKGWRGLNIDATPGSMELFRKIRPNDVNLEAAISDRKEPLVFSLFREGALNTFDRAMAQSYIEGGWALKGTVELVPQTLAEVLDQHIEAGQKIDLMSVDVEGEDLGVLRSNDWNRYCPEIVIIEALDTPLACLNENPVVAFLKDKGFVPTSRLFNSIIFQRAASVCAAS